MWIFASFSLCHWLPEWNGKQSSRAEGYIFKCWLFMFKFTSPHNKWSFSCNIIIIQKFPRTEHREIDCIGIGFLPCFSFTESMLVPICIQHSSLHVLSPWRKLCVLTFHRCEQLWPAITNREGLPWSGILSTSMKFVNFGLCFRP